MIPLSDRERAEAERQLKDVWGEEVRALAARATEEGIEDIAINPNGVGFVYSGRGKQKLETRFDENRRLQWVNLAARFAGHVAEGNGKLSFGAELPGRIRFQGGIKPRAILGPYIVMRFLPRHVRSFDDYIDDGIVPVTGSETAFHSDDHADAGVGLPTMDCIAAGLKARLTFSVFGETGSGKSSLLMTMLNHDHLRDDRIVTLEEGASELQFPRVEDVLGLMSEGTNMPDLLKDSLRVRPDRVVVGEARDGVLWTFIMAQYTGHSGGMVTMHASNPNDFFDRCEQMIAQAGVDPAPQRRVLMKTLQRIVWIRRKAGGGRQIVGVFTPDGYDEKTGYRLKRIDVPHQPRMG